VAKTFLAIPAHTLHLSRRGAKPEEEEEQGGSRNKKNTGFNKIQPSKEEKATFLEDLRKQGITSNSRPSVTRMTVKY